MGSLFEGTPQTATSYTTSSTDTPKWLQDAIYNQIQLATNVANTPFQSYQLPTVAELSPLQQQAYGNVVANQGVWQPSMNTAMSGVQNLAEQSTTGGLTTAQNQYLNPSLAGSNLTAGQNYFNKAGQLDVVGAGAPYVNQAATTTAQALSDKALNAAQPYLTAAAAPSTANISNYMNPYQQNVMDVIAKQGARNLSENLLPQVSDAFIKAGQFGGTRMGEFGSRALRDTQEAILKQQADLANQGYLGALNAAQTDLARQAGLAGTVGSISGADLSRVLSGAQQYGNLASTASGLTNEQIQNLTSLGQQQTAAGQQQQQFGLTSAQQAQTAQAADLARQQSALTALADMSKQAQGMTTADTAALEAAGAAQQANMQKQLDAAYQQYLAQTQYPKTQLDWLNTQIRGMAPNVATAQTQAGASTGQTYSASPLSQLAAGYSLYKGLTQ